MTNEQLKDEFIKWCNTPHDDASKIFWDAEEAMADWWLTKLEEAKKEALEGERERIQKILTEMTWEQFQNLRSMNHGILFDLHSKDEKLGK